MHMSVCTYVSMPVPIASAHVCVCMHVSVCTCAYCSYTLYYICIPMHICGCIFEKTQSSYVRFELLENGHKTALYAKHMTFQI